MTKTTTGTKSRLSRKPWTIETHAHWDEIVGAALLLEYGESLFPGISSKRTRIEIVEDPTQHVDFMKKISERRIPLGWGGPTCWFDEHHMRHRVTCAAELVAERLKIQGGRSIRRLLAQVIRCDNDSGVSQHHTASAIKRLQELPTEEGKGTWDRHAVFMHYLRSERAFVKQALLRDEVDKNLKFAKETFNLRDSGRRIRVGVIPADSPYVEEKYGSLASIICQEKGRQMILVLRPSGNIQVITGESAAVEVADIYDLLCRAELKKRGDEHHYPKGYFLRPQNRKQCRWWFFFSKRGQFLLNGSHLSARKVPPTVLTPHEILRIIMVAARERRAYREPRRLTALKHKIRLNEQQAAMEERLNSELTIADRATA